MAGLQAALPKAVLIIEIEVKRAQVRQLGNASLSMVTAAIKPLRGRS